MQNVVPLLQCKITTKVTASEQPLKPVKLTPIAQYCEKKEVKHQTLKAEVIRNSETNQHLKRYLKKQPTLTQNHCTGIATLTPFTVYYALCNHKKHSNPQEQNMHRQKDIKPLSSCKLTDPVTKNTGQKLIYTAVKKNTHTKKTPEI